MDCPDLVFAFVNRGSWFTRHNFDVTGQFTSPILGAIMDPAFAAAYQDGSADFLPLVPNDHQSTSFLSPFLSSTIADYRVEMDAEVVRRTHFRSAPSRLTGVYAFEHFADCEEASQRHGWPIAEVRRFQTRWVQRAVRANMEIVSLARAAYRAATWTQEQTNLIWSAYWGGEESLTLSLPIDGASTYDNLSSGVLWEWIIDGALVHEDRVTQDSTNGT